MRSLFKPQPESGNRTLPADDAGAKNKLLLDLAQRELVQSAGQIRWQRDGRIVKTYLTVIAADGARRDLHVQTHRPVFGTFYHFTVWPVAPQWLAARLFKKRQVKNQARLAKPAL